MTTKTLSPYEDGRDDYELDNGYNNTWISTEDQDAYRKGFMDAVREWKEYLKADLLASRTA
jgi:hypothetical protein